MKKPTMLLGLSMLGLSMLIACTSNTPPATPAPQPRVAHGEVVVATPQQTTEVISHDACRDDTLCALSGYCTSTAGGECIAASDAECEQSLQCPSDGACTARHGECMATSDAQCEVSEACMREGRCRANKGYCSQR